MSSGCHSRQTSDPWPKGLGKTATGGHSPLRVLGSRPWLFLTEIRSHKPPKANRQLSLAVCTREVLGSSPQAGSLVFARGGGGGPASGRGGSPKPQTGDQVRQRKGQECRGRFLATRGSGAEPKARRAGLPKCCTCAAASGIRAVRKYKCRLSTPAASSSSGDTPGGVPRQGTAKGGTRGRIGDKAHMWADPNRPHESKGESVCRKKAQMVSQRRTWLPR